MNKIQPSADVEARPWVSMSHSRIVCYLSRSDKFILAIIIGDGAFGGSYYVKTLFSAKPDFGLATSTMISVTCLQKR